MDDSFDSSLEFTLAEEGGFSGHPRDARFTSNHGISLTRLRRFQRDPGLDEDAVRYVPCGTVRAIYLADFWNRCRCDALPAGLDLMVFDHAVNAGADRSGRALQCATGQIIDGAVGPATLERAACAEPLALLASLAAAQRTCYRRMAAFGLFGDGWLARLERRRAAALALMAIEEPLSRR